MRILFYSDNFYPEVSGISDSIIALGRELVRRGHVVAFAVPKYSPSDYRKAGRDSDDSEFFDGLEVYRIHSLPYPNSPSGQARIVVPLCFSLGFARRWKPDIIHTQSPFGTGLEALFVSHILNVPIVGTNHTIMGAYLEIYGPRALARAADLFLFWYYRRMSAVTVPSQSLVDDMKARGYRGELQVVSNPISFREFTPAKAGEKEALRRELGLSGHIVIFAGRLGKEKAIEVVIRAVARLVSSFDDIKLVIAGNGPMEADLKKLAGELGILARVIFTGFLDHKTLAKWYKASDVFSSMMPIETQCLTLMQAFATALPSAGVNAGAMGQHIKPEFGYTVPEQDDAALSVALGRILGDPKASKIMGERALEYVQSFSEEKVADMWENIYTDNAIQDKARIF